MSNERSRLSFLRNGISQVSVVVPDLDAAMEHYWTWLGIGPWNVYNYGRPLVKEMAYHGEPAEFAMRIALSSLGALNIELIESLSGDTIYADFVAEHGYGLHHWGVFLDDIGPALEEARAAGLEVIQEGSGFGLDGSGRYAYLNTEDVVGVTIELVELPVHRAPPERVYPPQE